jgi:hypothetical protein
VGVVAALAVSLTGGGGPERTTTALPPLPNVLVNDQTWVCDGPVNINVLRVTMNDTGGFDKRNKDAVHLEAGCTGTIRRVIVTQYVGDGIKGAEGAHDLTIDSGSIRCLAKAPTLHQDGIQVMGGERITFHGLAVDCGRPGEKLINSNLFIRQGGRSTVPPTDVVCVGCTFGGYAAHTVSIQNSIRSGVQDSSICEARYSRLTLAVGPAAVDPVTKDDKIIQCGGNG